MNLVKVIITVPDKFLVMFTTLLQSGIEISCPAGKSLAHFLAELPAFTKQYITETVQTIFLDGEPVDNLKQGFTKKRQTLALSASMPGLAGAILRRNSFHAALRERARQPSNNTPGVTETIVTLKLFNTIAQDKGPSFLAEGITINSQKVTQFFTTRSTLLEKNLYIKRDNKQLTKEEFFQLLRDNSYIRLIIRGFDDK